MLGKRIIYPWFNSFLKELSLLFLFVLFFASFPSKAVAGTWTLVGPEGGEIKSATISPNFAADQTLFAGTSGGGVFKTTNGGTSWTAVNTGLGNLIAASGTIKTWTSAYQLSKLSSQCWIKLMRLS